MDKTPVCGTGTSGSTPGESTQRKAKQLVLATSLRTWYSMNYAQTRD